MGQRLDAAQPSAHRRIVVEPNTAFGRMSDIRVTGKVGDRGMVRCQKHPAAQMLVHEPQEYVRYLF